jgi:DHA1 family purine ribonucleoside efflux pump-like MFS transporter
MFGRSTGAALAATALWGFAFGGVPVAASIWNARVASDIAEPAGALLASAFQIAIAGGALVGGVLIDTVGPSGPVAFAAPATLVGGIFMLVNGRALETPHTLEEDTV